MKIGYVPVVTDEQNLALQRDALMRAGCETLGRPACLRFCPPKDLLRSN